MWSVYGWLVGGLVSVFVLALVIGFAVTGLREIGITVPCLAVGDPATAARERVARDLDEQAEEARKRCEEAGGDPAACAAEVERRRDRPLAVREVERFDPEAGGFDQRYYVRTAKGSHYRLSERFLAGRAFCSGMVIDGVTRPE
jgi:hypothetical protein